MLVVLGRCAVLKKKLKAELKVKFYNSSVSFLLNITLWTEFLSLQKGPFTCFIQFASNSSACSLCALTQSIFLLKGQHEPLYSQGRETMTKIQFVEGKHFMTPDS